MAKNVDVNPSEVIGQRLNIGPEVDEDKRKKVHEELDKKIEAEARDVQESKPIQLLATHIRACWDAAKKHKEPYQKVMYESALQRRGEYTPEKQAKFEKQDGTAIFMNLTSVKCRAAESHLKEIMSSSEKIWDIEPTPLPELPPPYKDYIMQQVQQEIANNAALRDSDQKELYDKIIDSVTAENKKQATDIANRMKMKMRDQLIDAKWREAIEDVIPDIVTYKAGFIKGPIVRRVQKLKWVPDPEQAWRASQKEVLVINYDRISPLNMYPSPTSTNIDDGYLIEKHIFIREDFVQMIGVPGYDDISIMQMLKEYSEGGLNDWAWTEDERRRKETEGVDTDNLVENPDKTIEALEFWGKVQGRKLLDWGMNSDEITSPYKEYDISAILVGNFVIKAVINSNPTGRKPYYKASYEVIPGQFWGRGIPELMRDIQDICNAAARSLVQNMAICSGPQIMVDYSRLRSGTSIERMYPWKVWVWDSTENQTIAPNAGPPISFFMPDSNAVELLKIFSYFEEEAEKVTGIPAYTYGGTDIGGAGRTATGLSMLMSNALKGIKLVLTNIDNHIIEPSLSELYIFNMLFLADPNLKGDLKIIARGVSGLMEKETLEIRIIELMQMLSQNPIYLKIIGIKGIATLLRRVVGGIGFGLEHIVPDENELENMMALEQELAQQEQQGMTPALSPQTLGPDGSPYGGADSKTTPNTGTVQS